MMNGMGKDLFYFLQRSMVSDLDSPFSCLVTLAGRYDNNCFTKIIREIIGHFPNAFSLFSSKVWYTAFYMNMNFHFHASKIHFHSKSCAPSLALKKRVKA